MESPLGVGGELVELLQQRELLRLQGVPPRAEQVQGLPIPEEDGLLTLMDDKLGAEIEVLNGVLPHKSLVVALILDDAGQTVLLDTLRGQPLRHIVLIIADGADVCRCRLGGSQPDAALGAGEFLGLALLHHGVDGFPTNRTLGLVPFGLVEHHHIAAVGTLPTGEFVCAHVDSIAAGTIELFSGKEARAGLGIATTRGAFDDKFRHSYRYLA